MQPKTSRDIAGPQPRNDAERELEKARIEDHDKTDQSERDRVHGDGHEIGLGRK